MGSLAILDHIWTPQYSLILNSFNTSRTLRHGWGGPIKWANWRDTGAWHNWKVWKLSSHDIILSRDLVYHFGIIFVILQFYKHYTCHKLICFSNLWNNEPILLNFCFRNILRIFGISFFSCFARLRNISFYIFENKELFFLNYD